MNITHQLWFKGICLKIEVFDKSAYSYSKNGECYILLNIMINKFIIAMITFLINNEKNNEKTGLF